MAELGLLKHEVERLRTSDARHSRAGVAFCSDPPHTLEGFLAELGLSEDYAPRLRQLGAKRVFDLVYSRRAGMPQTGRGDAAAATWIFRGEESRRRRGSESRRPRRAGGSHRHTGPDLDSAAVATWMLRGDESRRRRGCDVDTAPERNSERRSPFRLIRAALDVLCTAIAGTRRETKPGSTDSCGVGRPLYGIAGTRRDEARFD